VKPVISVMFVMAIAACAVEPTTERETSRHATSSHHSRDRIMAISYSAE
jgi:uncharacterized lipoprotein